MTLWKLFEEVGHDIHNYGFIFPNCAFTNPKTLYSVTCLVQKGFSDNTITELRIAPILGAGERIGVTKEDNTKIEVKWIAA